MKLFWNLYSCNVFVVLPLEYNKLIRLSFKMHLQFSVVFLWYLLWYFTKGTAHFIPKNKKAHASTHIHSHSDSHIVTIFCVQFIKIGCNLVCPYLTNKTYVSSLFHHKNIPSFFQEHVYVRFCLILAYVTTFPSKHMYTLSVIRNN